MRQIKYILINEMPYENSSRKSCGGRNLDGGYHYIVNSNGDVRELLDIRRPVQLINDLTFDTYGYNSNSIGILVSGSRIQESGDMNLGTCNLKQRKALIDLLVGLRMHFPDAKILGVPEIDGKDIRVSAAMNQLRLELSNEP